MANKENGKKKIVKNEKKSTGLKTQTKHGIVAVISFVLAIFLLMSMKIFNIAGVAGESVYNFLYILFGYGYVLLPTLFILLGISFIKSEVPDIGWRRTTSALMFLLSSLGIIDIASGAGNHGGGLLGEILSTPFVALFDIYASLVFLGAILIISILIMFDAKFDPIPFFQRIWSTIFKKKNKEAEEEEEIEETPKIEPEKEEEETPKETTGEKIKNALGVGKKKEAKVEEEEMPIIKKRNTFSSYVPPPISLLEEDKGKPNTGDIKANANIIKRTLANFGIEVEMDEITVGPTVTRYALKPAEGVKLSRIVGLQNDLSLSLAAHPIRIEAPIPGKSLVGIEIPNKSKSIVGLATLLSDDKFQNSPKNLSDYRPRNGRARTGCKHYRPNYGLDAG